MYTKPTLQMPETLQEGVYAASGKPEVTAYQVNQTAAWDGNKNYDITFTASEDAPSIDLKINCYGTITSISGNGSGSASGTTAVITFNNYGNGLTAGTTYTFYVNVQGTGDFALQ